MSIIAEKFGIVVLLDALGVQGASIQESRNFVTSLQRHAKGALDFIEGYASSAEIGEHYTTYIEDIWRYISGSSPNRVGRLPYVA